MEENKEFLDFVLSECCQGVEFDTNNRLYKVIVNNVSASTVLKLKQKALYYNLKFSKEELNSFLDNIANVIFLHQSEKVNAGFNHSDLLNGEVLQVITSNGKSIELIKMHLHEYSIISRDLELNRSIDFGNKPLFLDGNITIQGKQFRVEEVNILKPTKWHKLLDAHFMKKLYKYKVSTNLWPFFNDILLYPQNRFDTKKIISSVEKQGISLFTFFELSKLLVSERK